MYTHIIPVDGYAVYLSSSADLNSSTLFYTPPTYDFYFTNSQGYLLLSPTLLKISYALLSKAVCGGDYTFNPAILTDAHIGGRGTRKFTTWYVKYLTFIPHPPIFLKKKTSPTGYTPCRLDGAVHPANWLVKKRFCGLFPVKKTTKCTQIMTEAYGVPTPETTTAEVCDLHGCFVLDFPEKVAALYFSYLKLVTSPVPPKLQSLPHRNTLTFEKTIVVPQPIFEP